MMNSAGISYRDNVVDNGVRIGRGERYPIVRDYYDPNFSFRKKLVPHAQIPVGYVVQEKYGDQNRVSGIR